MLHLVGAGNAVDAGQDRNLPIVAGEASDDAAERTPVVEFARRPLDIDEKARQAPLVEMDSRSAAFGR